MKLSASIYSQENRPLQETIKVLDAHGIDLYHIDCKDDPTVFNDISEIRRWSVKPIDLHIISADPEQYFYLLEQSQPEYVTFQYENLTRPLKIPSSINSKLGLAITSETDISVFDHFEDDFDFILIMATTPGESGGFFDKKNFRKIRDFNRAYPQKSIHVDGGVNAEVSFILRNLGVSTAVSGSYLFNHSYLGAAMLDLKGENFPSKYFVRDFMLTNGEVPILGPDQRTLSDVLKALDDFRLGFVILANEEGVIEGIITNADLRKALLASIDDLSRVDVDGMINREPVSILHDQTVNEMLKVIKSQRFPISYVPVTDESGYVKGAVTFFNLIKGE